MSSIEAILFRIFPSAISQVINDYAKTNCHVCDMYADIVRKQIINMKHTSIYWKTYHAIFNAPTDETGNMTSLE